MPEAVDLMYVSIGSPWFDDREGRILDAPPRPKTKLTLWTDKSLVARTDPGRYLRREKSTTRGTSDH